MKSRIPMLVSAGFALIIALGVATSLFLDFEFQHAVRGGQAIDTGSLQLRASVRSLRADCLDMGQTVSARLLTAAEDPAVRLRLADLNRRFDEYLIRAIAAPCSEELRSILRTIQTRDRALIKSAQDQVLVLAGTDPARAMKWYLTEYMEAQTGTMRHLDRALQLASAETANLSDRWAADARRSERWAQLAIALFLVLGGCRRGLPRSRCGGPDATGGRRGAAPIPFRALAAQLARDIRSHACARVRASSRRSRAAGESC